jgi:ABC-type nitrate/sulfonate/bicarbonate transport system permease component
MSIAAKQADTKPAPRRQLTEALEFILPFVVVAGVWQLLAVSGWFPPVLIPSVPRVLQTGWSLILSGVLFGHLFASMARLLIGFAVGCVVGSMLGLAMGLSIRMERFFLPLLNLTLPIPSIALLPLTVLWFGLGNPSVVILVAFVVSLQVTLNTWTGVKTTSGLLLRVGQSMGAPRAMIIARIVLPSALPFVLTGLRLGLARGWNRHRRRRDGVFEQLGPWMDDLQRASIPANRDHVGWLGDDWSHRICDREACSSTDRNPDRGALGNAEPLTATVSLANR